MMKRLVCICLILFSCLMMIACNENEEDKGGFDELTLLENDTNIILENANIRVKFLKQNGAIEELYNKQSKVYLTKKNQNSPIRITVVRDNVERIINKINQFTYTLSNESDLKKVINFNWEIDQILVHATVQLSNYDNELVFRLSYEGNQYKSEQDIPNSFLYNIEYPIINNIDTLKNKETDYFLSPFVTGYLFNNPIENFNDKFSGITKSLGMYPSGWEYPMQFQSYFSSDNGGFMIMTKDSGDTIKSFTFTGNNDKLRMSIYHYLDDISLNSHEFDYDISISNLVEGSWYESALKYREWAKEQPWATTTEKLKYQDNKINKEFYEETILSNFCFPYTHLYGMQNQTILYEMVKNELNGGKILNIGFGNKSNYTDYFLNLSKNNDDLFMFFELPDLISVTSAQNNTEYWDYMIQTVFPDNSHIFYTIGTSRYFYGCAGDNGFVNQIINASKSYYSLYQVDGYYHDVGISAVHPRQCFNLDHDHGTEINIISENVEMMKNVQALAKENNNGIYGQELVFEQMLPYLDFYQARANGAQLSGMEHDRIMSLIESRAAIKVPLFDFIYSAYGAKRLDGFLLPDDSNGDGYYYVTAYTVINGGIVEYNYEFFTDNNVDYPSVDEFDLDRIKYLGYLYNIKKKFNDFLVYGDMVRPPTIQTSTSTYDYKLIRFDIRQGNATFDNIITSAFELDDKVAIFFANTSNITENLNIEVSTKDYYGIESGSAIIHFDDGTFRGIKFNNGRVDLNFTLESHEIAVIEIVKE